MDGKLIYEEESYLLNGIAMQVYKTLGNGFLEAVYQECMEIELRKHRVPFVAQQPLTLKYKEHRLKHTYRPDLICFGKIIVELKAVSGLQVEHKAQVMNCLKATSYKLGLLYNFGHYPLLEKERIPNLQ